MKKLALISISYFLVSCHSKSAMPHLTINSKWLDSISNSSDTSFTKRYRNNEFVTVDYYINRKDTTVCQVMKDSASTIRQVIIARKNIRLFTAAYFANGQQKAELPLDGNGKFHGHAKYYYANGNLKAEGNYIHGFYQGDWMNYNEKGHRTSIDRYDNNGQLTTTSK